MGLRVPGHSRRVVPQLAATRGLVGPGSPQPLLYLLRGSITVANVL